MTAPMEKKELLKVRKASFSSPFHIDIIIEDSFLSLSQAIGINCSCLLRAKQVF